MLRYKPEMDTTSRIFTKPLFAIPAVLLVVIGVIILLWLYPKNCVLNKYRNLHVDTSASDEVDIEKCEMEARKLENIVKLGIGRSYLHATNREAAE